MEEMVARTAHYFTSNPEAAAFIVTTHDGKIYRTEFESYAQHAATKGGGETVTIYREAHLVPRPSLAELVAGATRFFFPAAPAVPATEPAPALPTLGELVASATHFTFPATEPAAPVTEPAPAAARRGRKPAAATTTAKAKATAKVKKPSTTKKAK